MRIRIRKRESGGKHRVRKHEEKGKKGWEGEMGAGKKSLQEVYIEKEQLVTIQIKYTKQRGEEEMHTAWSGTQSVGLASPSSRASQLTSLVADSTPDLEDNSLTEDQCSGSMPF
jgi:hypothetical protein